MICSKLHTLDLHPRERTPVPKLKRMSGHQNPSGGFGEDSNISSQPAVEQRIAQPGASVTQ
jgi:hypothetical protein